MKKIEFKKGMVNSTHGISSKAKIVALGVGLTIGASGFTSCTPDDLVSNNSNSSDTGATYDSNSFDSGATYDSD